MCEHLRQLETDIIKMGIKETFRGKAWSNNCREWVYFDCYLKPASIIIKYNLPDFIKIHVNDDNKSGLEEGLICTKCNDAIIGIHNSISNTQNKVTIE